MNTKYYIFIIATLLSSIILLNGCEKPECPDGMHRVTVGDKSICVPDDLGREW
jgi:hypothetical protein